MSTVASNIMRLRVARSWSRAELARRSKTSRITLAKIERSEVAPRAGTLERVAAAFGVAPGALQEVQDQARLPKLAAVRFRATKRVHGRDQILAEVAQWLESYLRLEEITGSRLPFGFSPLVGAPRSPEKLAAEARDLAGLSDGQAVSDVCGLLEDNGTKVLLLDKKTDAFFGLSVDDPKGGVAIVVNAWDRISVERWIFTAAHELGHLLMHKGAFDAAAAIEAEVEEREADRFASYFLMPPQRFDHLWRETQGLPLIPRVFKIKRIFRVSYKTVLYRLVETRRANSDIWRKWNAQYRREFRRSLRRVDEPEQLQKSEFSHSWSRSGEPEALTASDFQQNRLLALAREAVERGGLGLDDCAAILGRSHEEMKSLSVAWADE